MMENKTKPASRMLDRVSFATYTAAIPRQGQPSAAGDADEKPVSMWGVAE